MNHAGSLSVRTKLVFMVVGTTLVSLASAFGFAIAHDVKASRRELVNDVRVLARFTAGAAVPDITFSDRREAEKTLGRLALVPHVRSARLFDQRGRPFAAFRREGAPPPVDAVPPEGPAFRGSTLFVTEPIVDQGERLGTIVLAVSTEDVERRVRGWIATAAVGMTVLVALALLAAWRLQRVVTEPLLALAGAARRVSLDHDYSIRVPKSGDDEIGGLTDGFNEMLGEIQKREEARERAEGRSREKSLFLAHMSHELRTPLNAIIGFSRILLTRSDEEIGERRRHFLENIRSSGEHLLSIIDNILDLSRVEAGRMRLAPESVAIPAVVDGVVSVMRGTAGPRRIAIRTDFPAGLPAIEADPVLLRQILYNLLANAVKFSQDGGEVTVSAREAPCEDAPGVEVAVADRGIGIEPADLELIFERFRQADGSAGRRFEGAGLGLSLVKSFVQLHGGRIRVESAPRRGSTFTVWLPLRQAPQPDAARTA